MLRIISLSSCEIASKLRQRLWWLVNIGSDDGLLPLGVIYQAVTWANTDPNLYM